MSIESRSINSSYQFSNESGFSMQTCTCCGSQIQCSRCSAKKVSNIRKIAPKPSRISKIDNSREYVTAFFNNQQQLVLVDVYGNVFNVTEKNIPALIMNQHKSFVSKSFVHGKNDDGSDKIHTVKVPVFPEQEGDLKWGTMNDVVFSEGDQWQYMTCDRKQNYLHLSKIISDNKLVFGMPKKFAVIYLDIETVTSWSEKKEVPQHTSDTAFVFTIQLLISHSNSEEEKIILVNGKGYSFDQKQIENTKVFCFENEQDMVRECFEIFERCGYVFCVTWNGSGNLFPKKDHYENIFQTGYDIPWILSRDIYKHEGKVIRYNNKYFTSISSEISKIFTLSKVTFIEAMRPVSGYLVQAKMRPVSMSLQNVAECFGLNGKTESNFDEMNMLFRNERGDITKHLVYGIQDCVVLKNILDRTDAIQTNFGMVNLLKCLPFDTLFHNTTAQCLESYYLNAYRQNGFLVPFASRISDKVLYKGAYTWNSERKIWLDGACLSSDVNSEYPSAIRHLQLAPDSLLHDDRVYEDVEENMKIPYGNGSIIPSNMALFLDERSIVKSEMKNASGEKKQALNAKQLALKLCANSTFGIFSSQACVLNCWIVSAMITSQGRAVVKCCRDFIENKDLHGFDLQMISIDTDSCTFQLDKEKHTNYQAISEFQDQINQHIAKEINPCFKFCHEEVIKNVILLGNKSYLWQYYDDKIMNKFTPDCQLPHSLKTRGVVLTGLSKKCQSYIQEMIDLLFSEVAPYECLYQIRTKIFDEIETAIKTRDMESLSQFAVRIKNSQKSKIAQAIRNRYPQNKDEHSYLVLSTNGLKKSESFIPMFALDENSFQVLSLERIAQQIISRCTKIVKASCDADQLKQLLGSQHVSRFNQNLWELQQEIDSGNNVLLRVVKKFDDGKIKHQPVVVEIDQLESFMIQNSDCEIHEYLCPSSDNMRVTFDIDEKDLHEDILAFVSKITKTLMSATGERVMFHVLKNDCKQAYHLLSYTHAIDREYLQILATEINRKNHSLVDIAIYNKNSQLRLPGSIKHSGSGRYQIPYGVALEDLLVSNIDGLQVIQKPLHISNECPLDDEYLDGKKEISSEDQELVSEYLDGLSLANRTRQRDGFIQVEILMSEYSCPICSTTHQSKWNLFAFVTNTHVVIKCHRHQGSTSIKLEKKEIKLTSEIDQAMTYLQRKTKISNEYRIQNNRYFQLDQLTHDLTFIVSALGTGKTECISKLIKEFDLVPIIITHRISLSNSLIARYPGSKSYQDMETKQILLSENKQGIICQIESIKRLIIDRPYILIIDEWESILTQLNSSLCQQLNVYERLRDLVENGNKVIVMDGYLQKSSVDLIESWSVNKSVAKYWNIFEPRQGQSCQIFLGDRKTKQIDKCLEILRNTTRAVFAIMSIKKAQVLFNESKKLGKKTIFLHGDNMQIMNINGKEISHAEYKQEILRKELEDFEILIYTSSITAGLSFDNHDVSNICAWFSKRTTDPFSFVQSIFRSRKESKFTIMLPSQSKTEHVVSPRQCVLPEYLSTRCDLSEQIRVFLKSRSQSMFACHRQIILRQLQRIGLSLDIKTIEDDENLKSKRISKIESEENTIDYREITQDEFEIADRVNKHLEKNVEIIKETENTRKLINESLSSGFKPIEFHKYFDSLEQLSTDLKNDGNRNELIRKVLEQRRTNFVALKQKKRMDMVSISEDIEHRNDQTSLLRNKVITKHFEDMASMKKHREQAQVLQLIGNECSFTSADISTWVSHYNEGKLKEDQMKLQTVTHNIQHLLGHRGYMLLSTEKLARTNIVIDGKKTKSPQITEYRVKYFPIFERMI